MPSVLFGGVALCLTGYPLDPLDVAHGGTRFKHAVGSGATLHDGATGATGEHFLHFIAKIPWIYIKNKWVLYNEMHKIDQF